MPEWSVGNLKERTSINLLKWPLTWNSDRMTEFQDFRIFPLSHIQQYMHHPARNARMQDFFTSMEPIIHLVSSQWCRYRSATINFHVCTSCYERWTGKLSGRAVDPGTNRVHRRPQRSVRLHDGLLESYTRLRSRFIENSIPVESELLHIKYVTMSRS